MSFLVIGAISFGVSLLTLFAGFGLGTMLLPAFALFFPVEVAVASTALVHGANSVFKVSLLAGQAEKDVVLRFGLPAIAASFAGALLLAALVTREPLLTWSPLGIQAEVTPVKLVMGILILGFALVEFIPDLRPFDDPRRWLPLGGALSGFFGGLSGHQGALRAIFLAPLGLPAGPYAATQAVIALLVDVARLFVYGWSFVLLKDAAGASAIPWPLVATATLCAFAGAYLGKRLLHKVTVEALRILVGVLLVVVGVTLALGIA